LKRPLGETHSKNRTKLEHFETVGGNNSHVQIPENLTIISQAEGGKEIEVGSKRWWGVVVESPEKGGGKGSSDVG